MKPVLRIALLASVGCWVGCGDSGFEPGGGVARIVLSTTDATLQIGQTLHLTATAQDASGSPVAGITLAWSSSNPTAARVGPTGAVQAVGVGDATINVTADGKTALADIRVRATVATVTVSPNPASVRVNATGQLAATLRDVSGNIIEGGVATWTTAEPSIATVSAEGVVTGVAVGTVAITASAAGKSASTELTVSDVPVATITVSPSPVSVPLGGTVQLTATARDAAGNVLTGRAVTWSSDHPAIASVGVDGRVTGEAVGSAVLTASAEGRSGTAQATVFVAPVASVTVSPDPASVIEGGTVQFTATLRDADGNVLSGRTVTWSSSATGVAMIAANGLATGVNNGTSTITASSEGQAGDATLTVTELPPASVQVSPGSAMIAGGGGTVQLIATLRDASGNLLTGRAVSWTSNNTGRATVSSSGLVTGQSNPGSVTITASSGGTSGAASVLVTRAAGTYLDQSYCEGGSSQKMDVYVPAASAQRPAPVAVFIHGGAWQDGDKTEGGWRFLNAKNKLVARGYIVANINYRLATATGNKWPTQIHDAKCAVKQLRASANTWGVDPGRFAAWGTSAGSHLAAMLGLTGPTAGLEPSQHTSQSSRVQAVADLAGPTDLTKPDELNFDYSVVFTSSADSINASPVSHVSGEDAPILILHGSNDTVVEEPQATALYNLLQLSGVATTFTRLTGLDHGFEPSGTATRDQIAEQIADFFDAHLGGAATSTFIAASGESYEGPTP